MKNWIYIIYMGLMGCLVSSCRSSEEEPKLPPGKVQVSFTIALNDIGSRASRASWEDNENAAESVAGSVFENQIDLTSEDGLQVFVYGMDGKLMGEVTDKDVYKVSDNTYRFEGKVEINELSSGKLDCRLMVYANCTGGLETFGYNAQYIPMWGVKETGLQLEKGEMAELAEPVYLLRSMAKVEVKLADDIADDFDLDSVSVNRYNTTGNVLPAYETLADTEDMDEDAVFNPTDSISETGLAFTEGGEDAFYIYLPEYQNVGEGTSPASMTLMVDGEEYTLEFKDYTSGTPFNIVRNHCYRYTITAVNTVDKVLVASLRYQSIPWTDVDNGELEFN